MSVADQKNNYKKINIEITSAKIHAVMNFKGTENTQNKCMICRLHIMSPTIEDSEKGDIKCNISKGKCGHFFHTDCINKHIKSGNLSCPIDFSVWNLEKILDVNNNNWNKINIENNNKKTTNITDKNEKTKDEIKKLIDAISELKNKK
jgi:hypothetical protein